MGGELAQEREWSHERSLDWHLLERPEHRGVQTLVGDLNRFYRDEPALWEIDGEPAGFTWLELNDAPANVIAFARFSVGAERTRRLRLQLLAGAATRLPRRRCRGRAAGARCSTRTRPSTAARASATAGRSTPRSSAGTASSGRPSCSCRRSACSGWPPRAGRLGAVGDGEATQPHDLAWPAVPARRDVGREGHQLLVLLGERGARRALPVRRRGPRAALRADAADGLQLARLPAGCRARAALRPACPWAVGARARPSLQPGQAAARSVRQGDRRRRALGGGEHAAVPAGRARGRADGRRLGRRGRDAALRRGRYGVRLGGRPATRDSLERDRDLRAAREGLHAAAPRRARGPARHLRGPRLRRRDRAPDVARRHGRGAAPGAPHRRGGLHPRARAHELLGLLVDRLPRPARRLCGHRGTGASRSTSSRAWSRRSTARASR